MNTHTKEKLIKFLNSLTNYLEAGNNVTDNELHILKEDIQELESCLNNDYTII